jgi:hypothetical protein
MRADIRANLDNRLPGLNQGDEHLALKPCVFAVDVAPPVVLDTDLG